MSVDKALASFLSFMKYESVQQAVEFIEYFTLYTQKLGRTLCSPLI
ncbi:hypothetical protein INT82_11015 [Mannheimia haemolytica]|nr:hypothetical protein [Mannheimia haemolytica]